MWVLYFPVYMEQNYLDRYPEDAITLVNCSAIVGLSRSRNPPNMWIKIAIQIKSLHWTKLLYPDLDLDCDPNNFAPYKRGIWLANNTHVTFDLYSRVRMIYQQTIGWPISMNKLSIVKL